MIEPTEGKTMEAIIFAWLDKILRLDRLLELTEEDTDE